MIDGARDLFVLDPNVAHLNHGSFGAVPSPVREARQRLLDEYDANPMRMVIGDLWQRVAQARERIATFLGAEPDLCALVASATTGVALVLNSLELRDGDEIVITDHGYSAVRLAVEDAGRRLGAKVIVAPVELAASADETVAAVIDRVTERTRLVIVDEISSATAKRHPTSALATVLRERGVPLFVDAAHSPGMLQRPLSGVDPDFWIGNMHKWAFAPAATALLRVTRARRDKLVPLVVSHFRHRGFPVHIEEHGAQDYTPWLAAPTGLSLFRRFGEAEIQRHNADLAAYGQQVIADALGLKPSQLPDPGGGVSMRVIPLPDGIATDVDGATALHRRIAAELGVMVVVNPWRGRGLLRISAQIYNSPNEYERLASGLPALLA